MPTPALCPALACPACQGQHTALGAASPPSPRPHALGRGALSATAQEPKPRDRDSPPHAINARSAPDVQK
jgi:hypothetical protein